MSDENILNMVRGIAASDKVAAGEAFNDAMRERIGAALEAKRIEVAQSMVPGAGSENFQTDFE